jgi:hypothetical protein
LLIHASGGMTRGEYEDVVELLDYDPVLSELGIKLPAREVIERGGVVGVAQMAGSVQKSQSPWFFGPHGFVLSEARAFATMIPFKGQLGFFDVPDALIHTPTAAQAATKE